jgi:hypothetical protein
VGTRLDASGTVLDPTGITVGAGYGPELASNGSGYLAAWSLLASPSTSRNLMTARIDIAGAVSNMGSVAYAQPVVGEMVLAGSGQGFLLLRADATGRDYAMRLGPSGLLLDPVDGVLLPGVFNASALGATPNAYLAVSAPLTGTPIDASASLVPGTPCTIGFVPAFEQQQAATRSGTGAVVAWESGATTLAAHLDEHGQMIEPTPVPVSIASTLLNSMGIGTNGDLVLLTWVGPGSVGAQLSRARWRRWARR